jgi:hypothetical protein
MKSKNKNLNRRPLRPEQSFQRSDVIHPDNETVFAICEGETEVNYLNHIKKDFRLHSLNPMKCPTGSAPINIVEYAIEYAKTHEGVDRIYCVFDRDAHSTYKSAIEKLNNYVSPAEAKSKPIFTAILSVPCFEIWLLLHFKYTSKPYSHAGKISPCENLTKDLQKYLPDYNKSKSSFSWYPKLQVKLSFAIKNAVKLEKELKNTDSLNPSTNIHTLINYLHEMSLKNI